jgi:peptidoglycan/LPS O-acetylase OafA/YrhL
MFIRQLDSLTGIRAIFAIMVVLCHGCIRCQIVPNEHWISKAIGEMGHAGVAGFFVLSGYILAHVYRDRKWSTREFAANRFARIYPLYFVGLLFTLPMDWLSPGMSSECRSEALGLSVILQQSWFSFSNGRFNGPGWTLSVETLFYTLFPILFYFWKRSPFFFNGSLIAVGLFTAYIWNPDSFFSGHRFPLMRVWEFMFGMALALIPLSRRYAAKEIIPLSLIIGTPAVAALLDNASIPFIKWFVIVILAGISILMLAARDMTEKSNTECDITGIRPSLLRLKWAIIGGEISYGIYLFHDGVQRYFRVGFEKILGVLLIESPLPLKICYLMTTAMVSVLLAWICWMLIEIPTRKFLRNKLTTNG